ncbi:MAG: hypothetical protein LBD64_08605 [Odoribacteraceae bacterium]|nr:hypothetical protein [Odoribacteraceae bacterium]
MPYIHDYCDRWCARCQLTSRCLSHAVEKWITARKDLPLADGYESLSFSLEEEAIYAIARDRGATPESLLGEDQLEGTREELEKAEGDEDDDEAFSLLREQDVYYCFCIYELLIDEQQESLYEMLDRIEDNAGDLERVRRVEESLSEVNWYMDLLYSKLKRAYYACSVPVMALADAAGSAKVALLAADASVKAWTVLRDELPEVCAKINWIVVTLEQIREELTTRFPGAVGFKRPGFDSEKPARGRKRAATGRWI